MARGKIMSIFEIGMTIGMVYLAMFVTYKVAKHIIHYVSTHEITEKKHK